MTADKEPLQIQRSDLEQARRVIEVIHGDHLRTAYLPGRPSEEHIQQAQGVSTALNIIKQVEDGEWDADLASEALDGISAEDDPDLDADALRDLSQYDRSNELFISDHPIIERAMIQPASRSYWQLLKDLLGVGDRV